MENKSSLDYYHLKTQLPEKFGCNLDQLRHIATTNNMRIWVDLAKYNKNVKVFEIKKDIFSELNILPIRELIEQGYTIKRILGFSDQCQHFTATKDNHSFEFFFMKDPNKKNKWIKHIPASKPNKQGKIISHDNGYIELFDKSFVNPKFSIIDLFSMEDDANLERIFQVKSEKDNHECYLDKIYSISLNDIYVRADEYKRIETILLRETHEVTNEQIYNHKLTSSETNSLREDISNENSALRTARIKKQADFYERTLQEQYPHNEISREKIIKMIYRLEMTVYRSLRKKQPTEDTYIRMERKERNKNRRPSQ